MPQATRKNPRIVERNELIRKRYTYYSEEKHFKNEHILKLLESEYKPLLADTIWLIVSQTGFYKDY